MRRRDRIRAWRDTEGQKCPPRDRFRKMPQRDKKTVSTLFNKPILSYKMRPFLSDYKDIQRTAKINVPKGTEIGSRTSLASQRIQKCARIRVNECEYTKNWKNVFADVCIFFLTAASFADFCIFSVPPPSLGIVSVPRN